jgi:hypothetical protein
MEPLAAISFKQHYQGAFTNMLRWHQLDQLWARVKAEPAGWYVYFVGKAVPLNPVDAETCHQFIDEIDQLLRHEHDYDYCGIVYADSPQNPILIKIFDPNHLGASCGSSGEVIPPGWILSRIPPEPIEHTLLIPENRKRWWQRLFPK